MTNRIPIQPTAGIRLGPTELDGIASVSIQNSSAKYDLSWDRFVRLNAAATAILELGVTSILDAGGYDGALAFFLEDVSTDLIDPATTGGSILNIPAETGSYDAVVAVDVLEHIEPQSRSRALAEFARVASDFIILNYPCTESKDAQRLVLQLTNNALIREHVEWELPDTDQVLRELASLGFTGIVVPHTSIAIWLGQYITLILAPETAKPLNQHLIANYCDEPFSKPLYHLLICKRAQ